MQRKNHEMSPQLYLLSIYHPWNKFKTKLLCIFNAAKFVGICWHQDLKGNKHAFWPQSPGGLRNTTLSKVFKHAKQKQTRNDVLSILAMLHFGGKGDYELTLSYAISLWKSVPGWLEATGSILSHFQATLDCNRCGTDHGRPKLAWKCLSSCCCK